MAQLNKIFKYHLESRALELQGQGVSLRKMALILSEESGQDISKNNVDNFLTLMDKGKAEIIEKKEELKIKVAEAEISTIKDRQFFIDGMKALFEESEDEKIKVMASVEGTKMLESLDKRLGAISPDSNVTNINIQQNNLTIKDKIQRYREMGILNGSQ